MKNNARALKSGLSDVKVKEPRVSHLQSIEEGRGGAVSPTGFPVLALQGQVGEGRLEPRLRNSPRGTSSAPESSLWAGDIGGRAQDFLLVLSSGITQGRTWGQRTSSGSNLGRQSAGFPGPPAALAPALSDQGD